MAGEAIFIGYRRDDTADVAGRIFDALEARFGRDRVFKDVDNIPVGANFGQYIKSILPRCRVALILMGPHWVDARDASGKRRLEDPNDWVRIEIETALATPDLQVVPVLVNGAQMPRAEDLPATLQPILHLNAAVIRRDPDFRDDIDRLGTALRASVRTGLLDLGAIGGSRKAPPAQRPKREGKSKRTSVAAITAFTVLLVGGAGAGWWSWQTQQARAAAEREFAAASEADTPQALEEFLAAHPNSAHALAARGRIAELRASGVTIGERFVRAGEVFDDCDGADWCPQMVVIPAGSFVMGEPRGEDWTFYDTGPPREVRVGLFAAGKFEVTFDQWAACASRGGCSNNASPSDEGWGGGARPVINVSWSDAQEYVRWLSDVTGQTYRLLSEAEWEYAARAGTTTDYYTGSSISSSQANFNRPPLARTQPVGAYPPNPFGLHDMPGNVWEWVQDCYVGSYSGLPTDGSAFEVERCSNRVERGGAWFNPQELVRSAARSSSPALERTYFRGFRVARTLN